MIKLYAQAAIYSPSTALKVAPFDLPVLPDIVLEKTVQINNKHCDKYNQLTEWKIGIAAVIHPNYIQTLSLPMQIQMMVTDPFPFKPMGLVHVANKIDVSFLPEQNASLQLSTAFGDVYYHRRGWLFEVITQAEVGGVMAVKGTSYYLARKKHSAEVNKYHQDTGSALPSWILDMGHNKHTHEISSVDLVFQADTGRRYAKVSGDYNPIHLYPYTAKLLGFNKAIAHGMFSKAWAVSKVAQQRDFYKTHCCLKTVFMQPITLPLQTQLISSKKLSDNDQSPTLYFSLNSNKRSKNHAHLVGSVSELAS